MKLDELYVRECARLIIWRLVNFSRDVFLNASGVECQPRIYFDLLLFSFCYSVHSVCLWISVTNLSIRLIEISEIIFRLAVMEF